MINRHIVAALGLTLLLPAAAGAAPRHQRGVNARQERQAARIQHGVKDGEITRAEADRLRGDEAAIRAEERVYRRTGDGLTPQERRDLERDLNRTNRETRRATHNERERN